MKFKAKPPLRARRRKEGEWTEGMLRRMLTNPFYFGLVVDSKFTEQRPLEESYEKTAVQMIHEVGAGVFLTNFFARLKDPSHPLPDGTTIQNDRLLERVGIHPYFAQNREALIPEETFVQAAIIHIADSGPDDFMREMLENLRGNWIGDDGPIGFIKS